MNSTESGATIIVPVFNSPHLVRPCLESICRWTNLEKNFVVIVDDGSDTYTAEMLDEYVASNEPYSLIRHPRNLGFVSAANRGLEEVRSRYAVLLNSDTCVTPGWLQKMIRCFESDPAIAVASPLSNFAPHMRIPMPPGYDYIATSRLVEMVSNRRYPDVTTPEGFCFMVRMAAIQDIGSFDLVFRRGYGEESDLSMRARYAGYRTVCIDDTYIYHRGRGSFGQETRDKLYQENRGIFHDRWGDLYKREFAEFTERDPLSTIRAHLGQVSQGAAAFGG